jgi:hypothetical protein
VLARLPKLLIALALAGTIGLHWTFLQTVAWAGMIVSYSQEAPLVDAVEKTFDGQHPCKLCKAIADGRKSERKKEFTAPVQKLEFPPVKGNLVLIAPMQFRLLPEAGTLAASLTQKPPTPPPRGIFT